jgi:hypothetical protein
VKRSPMPPRVKPLERTPFVRKAVSSLPRAVAPLRRVSAKRAAGRTAYETAKLAVWIRDGGECQARECWPEVACGGRIDPHHIAPQGIWPELRAVEDNMKCVCRSRHSFLHDHPIQAREVGLLR